MNRTVRDFATYIAGTCRIVPEIVPHGRREYRIGSLQLASALAQISRHIPGAQAGESSGYRVRFAAARSVKFDETFTQEPTHVTFKMFTVHAVTNDHLS